MKDYINKFLIEEDILKDSLLLEYSYSSSNNSFEWIGRPGVFTCLDLFRCPFIKLSFLNVNNFKHKLKKESIQNAYSYFSAKDNKGAYISYGTKLVKKNKNWKIDIEIAHSLGNIVFEFSEFKVDVLYTKVVKQDEKTWIYYEEKTGNCIDFFFPFTTQLYGVVTPVALMLNLLHITT